ncbi:MAG: pilV [Burkholderia sp.]|nr:pilV [Burkholderia sp.]
MKKRQGGVTIIEVLGVLAIGAMLLVGLTAMVDSSLEDFKGQQAAHYQAQVVNAARKYITANYPDLIANPATSSSAVPVTVERLKIDRFLPGSFEVANPYLQTPCVLVRQPTPGKLDALVVTSGGQPIPESNLAAVAMAAGPGSGYISRAEPGTARGATWNLVTTDYRAVACGGGAAVLTGTSADSGHLASGLFSDSPGQFADFLYRSDVPGRPELNQMNTPVRMANHALVVSGTACGTQAAMAIDSATRDVAVCGADGVWKNPSSWKQPVVNFGDLPVAGNNTGDVRMVTSLNRAFTYNTSGSGPAWKALAVDQNGDFAVPGNIQVGGTLQVDEDVVAGRDVRAGRDTAAARNMDVLGQANIGGNAIVTGGVNALWMSSGAYEIRTRFWPGTACNYPAVGPDGIPYIEFPTGTVVADLNGLAMSCYADNTFRYQSGTYAP